MLPSPERFTVAVRPAGTWGAVWALVAAEQGHNVKLNFRNQQDCEIFNTTHTYRRVPGVIFPENIYATTDPDKALEDVDVLAIASRSQDVRELVRSVKWWKPKRGVVNLSKGLEEDTNLRLSQVLAEEHPDWMDMLACWSGPNIAGRIASEGRVGSAEAHIASTNHEVALFFEKYFGRGRIRLVPTNDVIGTEYGGSLKNAMTMGKALIDHSGLGEVLKIWFRYQALKEMSNLGVSYGACRDTFKGPSGAGDLDASIEYKSRNYEGGLLLASGQTGSQLKSSDKTFEGIWTVMPAFVLSRQAQLSTPIIDMVYQKAYPEERLLKI